MNELVEAADDRQLSKTITHYGRVNLLCIAELSMWELDRGDTELLFQFLTEREERPASPSPPTSSSVAGSNLRRPPPQRRHHRPLSRWSSVVRTSVVVSVRTSSTGRIGQMGDASDLVYGLELITEGGPEQYAGSDLDVRAVVARIPQHVKDELRYDQIPWGRFLHAYGPAVDVPGYLKLLGSPDVQAAGQAVGSLGNCICHQGGTYAPAALAVPFLLRLAGSPATHHRGEILRLVGEVTRREHYGDGSRAGLLRVAHPDDQPRYDVSGYLENWSVHAARIAVTSDAPLLLALLDDIDAEVRCSACYALATALHEVEPIDAALRRRLSSEEVPAVRMSLILAIAQLAREHRDESTVTRLRTWWADPDQPADIRVSAALSWLCLVDVPVPDDLRLLLTTTVDDELAELLAAVPWMREIDWGGAGLRRCIHLMLNPEVDWRSADEDPWAEI